MLEFFAVWTSIGMAVTAHVFFSNYEDALRKEERLAAAEGKPVNYGFLKHMGFVTGEENFLVTLAVTIIGFVTCSVFWPITLFFR